MGCRRTIISLILNLWKRRTKQKFFILAFTCLLMIILRIRYLEHSAISFQFTEVPHTIYAQHSDIPNPKVKDVDCLSLFRGVRSEKYENIDSADWHLPDDYFIHKHSSCEAFINARRYIMKPVSVEEAGFPLAFSLLVYKDVHQIEQLLRMIYRPQNYYCIHVDAKANETVYKALSIIAGCFENVFLSTKRLDVAWGEFSVLEPELNCMQELWNKTDWRYFINLTGQEFPLKTMLDIVRILKVFNGSNAINTDPMIHNSTEFQKRVLYEYKSLDVTAGPKPPPPHNIQYTFGPLHVAVTRSFVDFVLHDPVALDFREWVNGTNVPDETFFTSLQINPQVGVPGAFTGDPFDRYQSYDSFIRYKLWLKCGSRGLVHHMICILGVHNLYDLGLSYHMFANKFLSYHQPVARMCLEERLYNRTRVQLTGGARLNLHPYKELIMVKHHNPS